MYQIKAQNGYEIQVIGKGLRGKCRVTDRNQEVQFEGTYNQCRKWLAARAVKLLG